MMTSTSNFHTRKFMTTSDRAEAASLPVAERMDMIRSLLVRYARYRDAEASIRRFHKPVANGGSHNRGKIGAVVGVTGAGKSYVLRNYVTDIEDLVTEDGRYKRAVYVNVIRGAKPLQLAADLYTSLGFPHVPNLSFPKLTAKVMLAINEPKSPIELVIVDDVQYLLGDGTSAHARDTLGLLTGIAKGNRCNVLLGGTAEIGTIVHANPHTKSLGMLHRFDLKPYDWAITDEREQFRLLLAGIDDRLPFAKASSLANVAVADSLYRASGGAVGRVMSYVEAAAFDAMDKGQDRITRDNWLVAAQDRQSPDEPLSLFLDVAAAQTNVVAAIDGSTGAELTNPETGGAAASPRKRGRPPGSRTDQSRLAKTRGEAASTRLLTKTRN